MNLNELKIKKLDVQSDILVATYSLCFDNALHIDGFRVYYNSEHHQYSVAMPSNVSVASPKIRKQITNTILCQIDKDIISHEVRPYKLNDNKSQDDIKANK
jgi:DNA-binding cell septation regulator SpoVG